MAVDVKDPFVEVGRLQEVARLRLQDWAGDNVLDALVKEAAREFDLPIGLVSIVLDDAQYFAAAHGLAGWLADTMGTPIEWSFCANSVATGAPFIVEDALSHAVVSDNPLVTQDGITCYAGAPLITQNGYVLGNFCVLGSQVRTFTEREVARLEAYAARAIAHVEAMAS